MRGLHNWRTASSELAMNTVSSHTCVIINIPSVATHHDRISPLLLTYWNPHSYTRQLQMTGERTRAWIPLLIVHLVVFSVGACLMNDKVYSQPLLAVAGIVTAACGTVVSHGILYMLGVPLIQIAMITPFLVVSVGVTDMFVMLNVWRQTDVNDSVEVRMRETFSEAAVSVTIMRLTGEQSEQLLNSVQTRLSTQSAW